MNNNYGAPHYLAIIPTVVPFNTVGVWDVSINYESMVTFNKDLVTILNGLKNTHGIFCDTKTAPGVVLVRNISELDHVIEITYTGNVLINYPFERFIAGDDLLVYNNGLTYNLSLGGFNASTVWVYPPSLKVSNFQDGDITRTHIEGNSYILEVDGIKYTDPREFTDDSTNYGSLEDIISLNNLSQKLAVRGQALFNGNYHNEQLVNIDTVPHTVRYYLDKTKPHGNLNTKSGIVDQVYRGKAIYCKDDTYVGAPVFGSVNNRLVNDNGFIMTLAKASIPPMYLEHSFDNVIDTRVESIITLNGTVSTGTDNDYSGEIPEIYIGITVGNNYYTPDIVTVDDNHNWTLSISSKVFTDVDFYTVSASRLGGTTGYNLKEIVIKPRIIRQLTKFDTQASLTTVTNKVVFKDWFTIPNTYTAEQIAAMQYESGTRSGDETKTATISILGEELHIRSFISTWLVNNTQPANGSSRVMLRSIGEVGIFNNTATGDYSIDLVSAAESPIATPFYNTNQYDYAYVSVTGLGAAVFENSMFSNTDAGKCFYIDETDTNLWIMRL